MKDLSTGNISSIIFRFTLPMLLGNVFQQLYNVVDSIVVGNYLGKEALAAVGASFPVMFALISLVLGIATGSTIIISQYFGAKDYKKVKQSILTMYVIVLVASVFISIIGITFSESIFRLIKLPESIIPQATLYLDIIIGGIIMTFGMSATNSILRGLGDSRTPLYFLIASSILNLAFVLIFVLIFHWGIAGAAIATVLAQAIAFFGSIIYLIRTHELFNDGFKDFTFDWDTLWKSVRIGLPSGFQHMFVSIGMIAVYRIVNQFDTNVIAAYSVVGRIDSFAIMPAMNFAMALTIFVGQNIGANRFDRVRGGLISTLLMTAAISIVFTGVSFVFGRALMSWFSSEPQIIEIGYQYLVIVSSFYLVFSIMFCLNAVYRGAGDTVVPMFITLLALWLIRIPISWKLAEHMGPNGVWWGIPLGWFAGMLLSIAYYYTGIWKKRSLLKFNE